MAKNSLKNIKSELKKVIWPTKKQLANNTLMVIGLAIVFSAAILIFDLIVKNGDALLWNIIK